MYSSTFCPRTALLSSGGILFHCCQGVCVTLCVYESERESVCALNASHCESRTAFTRLFQNTHRPGTRRSTRLQLTLQAKPFVQVARFWPPPRPPALRCGLTQTHHCNVFAHAPGSGEEVGGDAGGGSGNPAQSQEERRGAAGAGMLVRNIIVQVGCVGEPPFPVGSVAGRFSPIVVCVN